MADGRPPAWRSGSPARRRPCWSAPAIASAGFRLAVENLAPVWPGSQRICHAPHFVRNMVERIGSAAIGMLLDLGHAHIQADLAGGHLRAMVASVADAVILFHLHDNLGARRDRVSPGIDPLRLDLHLAPGAGKLPWHAVAPLLLEHEAPLMLEVHPPHRPEPLSLATVTAELLLRDGRSVDGARAAFDRAPGGRATVPLG